MDIFDALVEIGNHKRVIEACEPNIMQPLQLERWMVNRIILAQELLQNEWNEIQRTVQSDNRDNGRIRSKGIRKVPKK